MATLKDEVAAVDFLKATGYIGSSFGAGSELLSRLDQLMIAYCSTAAAQISSVLPIAMSVIKPP